MKNLKLDTWFSIFVWCGVVLFASGLIFEIELINKKHIIGVGIGMFIVGISNIAAVKPIKIPEKRGNWLMGYWTGQGIIHNKATTAFSWFGWLLIALYGGLILWELI